MIGFNGGLIGTDRTTSLAAASGVWTLDEQIKARRSNLWPVAGLVTASGGTTNDISDGGINYRVHTFTTATSVKAFDVTIGGLVEYFIVAGGGGGGGTFEGGGGGAGGLLTSSVTIAAGTYSITIGSGGVGRNGATAQTSGGNSVFSTFTATGGGRGASSQPSLAAASGGSGGGGTNTQQTGAAGTSGQGFAGGNGSDAFLIGGGGGGAGGVGTNATSGVAQPAGGAGVTSSFDGTSKTYAAGGAGAARASNITGAAGATNRGSGGGGGSSSGGGGVGGAGSDGIVMIRYPIVPVGKLLSDYPNASVAYSLRLLDSVYSGNLVLVRRESDNAEQGFNEAQISGSGAGSLANFCSGTNGFVKTWYDQSGNANNATQSNTSIQPQIVTNGTVNVFNGRPCLTYNNNGNTNLIFSQLTNIISVFQVLNIHSSQTGAEIFLLGDSDEFHYHGSSSSWLEPSASLAAIRNGSNRINNTITNLTTTGKVSSQVLISMIHTGSATASQLSQYGFFFPRSMRGNIQEVILYSTDQSSNVASINGNINSYYAIY